MLLQNTPSNEISHKVSIMPRFAYSINLLEMILTQLNKKQVKIKNLNLSYFNEIDVKYETDFKQIEYEVNLCVAFEVLKKIQKTLHSVERIDSITNHLPATISALRIIASNLFSHYPSLSQNIYELTGILGGIIVDSANITEAKFDFVKSNQEARRILDEAKLIVGSKLSMQYPKLDFVKSLLNSNDYR